MRVVVLSGGVGGSRLVEGLAAIGGKQLTVLVNTADDTDYYGLHVSPDLDTNLYVLAGIVNPQRGWGVMDERWTVEEQLKRLGEHPWFHVGDRDLATHLIRTAALHAGHFLSEVTADLCRRLGVESRLIPMTDDPVQTFLLCEGEWLPFQEYFVHRQAAPLVRAVAYRGSEHARPVEAALRALEAADLIVFAPSNPYTSLLPILAVSGYREVIRNKLVFAVSPLIGGQAVKGSLAAMLGSLAGEVSLRALFDLYGDIVDGWLVDPVDMEEARASFEGVVACEPLLLTTHADRVRVAQRLLQLANPLKEREDRG
ncbi:MAG: 2-phospho-L-lactate transferase [Firmicutes bacterium]|nr:2-phospho-L-lactate transferase [Bacillota bacterium]